MEALVSVGAPLRWASVHPALRVAFTSRRIVGRVPIRGTRKLARATLPFARFAPGLLSIYMNADHVDLSRARALTNVVDNPHPRVNRDIAQWVRDRDLHLDGVNVTEALADCRVPALLIVANRDGIVPLDSALAATAALGGRVDVIEVGTESDWYAHADLFIAPEAEERVFEPMADWLGAVS